VAVTSPNLNVTLEDSAIRQMALRTPTEGVKGLVTRAAGAAHTQALAEGCPRPPWRSWSLKGSRFGSELVDPRPGVSRLRVGYLTGAVNADWDLKVLNSGKNRARLANSGRVVAQGLVRVHCVEI
jgi:hypothetical protein